MANIYDFGDEVRFSGTIVDSDGSEVDPTTVKVDIKNPNGTVTTYTYGVDAALIRDDAGDYHIDQVLNISGRWFYRFYSEGTYIGAEVNEVICNGKWVV